MTTSIFSNGGVLRLLLCFTFTQLGFSGTTKNLSGCAANFDAKFRSSLFPDNFMFGASTAAFQVEGATLKDGRGPSIWDTFTNLPGKISGGQNASTTVDSYHKYMVDVSLLKSQGFKHYRFSISWSRILPKGRGAVNPLGIAYYNNLINALIAAGITPVVTLYHWDLPEYLHQSYGGWLSSAVINDFAAYADLVFKTYGNRVKKWITINEPKEVSIMGYASGLFAPGRCSNRHTCSHGNSSTEPYIVAHNLLLSHAKVVALYRTKYKASQKGVIGIAMDTDFFYPLRNTSKDISAAQTALLFNFGWFADPVMFGDYPAVMKSHVSVRLPKFTTAQKKLLKGSSDFLGVNVYTAAYAYEGSPPPPGTGQPYTDPWIWAPEVKNGVPIGNKSGSFWLYVVPTAIYDLPIWIRGRYGNIPIIITENGVSDVNPKNVTSVLCDKNRVSFYEGYLKQLLRALKAGVNVKGYFTWSLMDNFEWAEGYSAKFGIFYVDFKDPSRTRHPKLSALWWRQFLS